MKGTSRFKLSAGKCSPICIYTDSHAALATLNYKDDDKSFSSAALQRERWFVQSPEIITSCVAQLHCATSCICTWEMGALNFSSKLVLPHYKLEAGDVEVLKIEKASEENMKTGMRKRKVDFPCFIPYKCNILPIIRDKSTGWGAAARRAPSLSQAPGALKHGARTKIILTDISNASI